jgi:hypothetical protein
LVLALPNLEARYPLPTARKYRQALAYFKKGLAEDEQQEWTLLIGWLFLHNLGKLTGAEDHESVTASWINEWQFGRVLSETGAEMGLSQPDASGLSSFLKILVDQQRWFKQVGKQPLESIVQEWLSNAEIQRYLNINRHEEALWYNKERFERFVWWMAMLAVLSAADRAQAGVSLFVERILLAYNIAQQLLAAGEKSAYQVSKLLKALQSK